ncbi:S1C family serine protease [Eoetvoesiella caeni]|uniref:Serine protease DegQ n=1 Tax=Eoetvoesiella caeni TaxID=645616 RepID=A0A366H3T3_9BURK|nr:trypsin-like peptidase domain-containing protein [Eoetvoesiella caeni]MCI2808287.1 trypsin-like peptidase domain-containing protein [Eoetvoesiella caeni]NYT53711.1 trypsin-like peptidase domain-containing protein [Eoetvoesiella caeni]RBP35954.1 serine protease DegQ [Eoetvoesiella caeni]
MHRFWLLFAQSVTICLAALFIVTTLRPDWLGTRPQAPVKPAPTRDATLSYAAAVARVAPAVVNVYTTKQVREPLAPLLNDPDLERLFGDIPGLSRRKKATTLGSGVIVRGDGYILTNYHVIEAADAVQVALYDGRQAKAEVVGADPDSDLAVLKIQLPNLSSITFNGNHELKVGDVVLAIGNPFGVGQTTTLGIVSALGRNRLGINTYENFIQTDAAINPGNSGGALVDASGRLVGINTAIYSESGGSLGIGFAIPAKTAHTIMEQIIATGSVKRGWLGLEPQDITPELARAFRLKQSDGVIVADVLRDGPAWKAGVRVGDIVLKLNDQAVEDSQGFLNQIAPLEPGKTVGLSVLRAGKRLQLNVKIGTRPRIIRPQARGR